MSRKKAEAAESKVFRASVDGAGVWVTGRIEIVVRTGVTYAVVPDRDGWQQLTLKEQCADLVRLGKAALYESVAKKLAAKGFGEIAAAPAAEEG